jgi:hypothetical protein
MVRDIVGLNKEFDAMNAMAQAVEDLDADALGRVARWFAAYAGSLDTAPGRTVSVKWQVVLASMLDGAPVTYDEMQKAAVASGHDLTWAQARAQCYSYVKNGMMAAADDGKFVITLLGRDAITKSQKPSDGIKVPRD